MASPVQVQDAPILILYDDSNLTTREREKQNANNVAISLYNRDTKIKVETKGYTSAASTHEPSDTRKWIILIYTSQAQSILGDTVFRSMNRTIKRAMSGIIIVTTGQDTPPPEWNIIRQYQYDGKDPQIYETISRALQYTKVPYAEAKQASGIHIPSQLGGQNITISTGRLILISLICAFIILGGASAIIIPRVFQSQGHGTAIATVTPTKAATHTPVPTITPTTQGTPVPTVDPATKQTREAALKNITSKNPTFTGFVSTQWPASVINGTDSCVLGTNNSGNTNDTDQVTISQDSSYAPCLSALPNPLKNFVYQVSVSITGDAAGIIFRAYNNNNNYYRFSAIRTLDPQKVSYSAILCDTINTCINNAVNQGTLLPVQGSLKVEPKQPIQLTVLAQDKNIDLYINGTYVARVVDNAIHAGQIGVYAALFGSNATTNTVTNATFTGLKVWSLDK